LSPHPEHLEPARARERRPPGGRPSRRAVREGRARERSGHRDRRASGGLCRLAEGAEQAHGSPLRPLRRPAGRSPRPLDVTAVRTDSAGWSVAGPRLVRRQGPDRPALAGDSGAAQQHRRAALEPEGDRRGRGRDRQPHFEAFVDANAERLKTTYCVVSDTSMVAKGFPAITYALRGLIYVELRVEVASTDMHSGLLGGMAPNPAQALAEILVRLKDAAGHVLVPGFYDGVRPLSEEE